jgi:hypothetical protein
LARTQVQRHQIEAVRHLHGDPIAHRQAGGAEAGGDRVHPLA